MFENFWGNAQVVQALEQMIEQGRLSQTLLFSGPEGAGKATLARRLGARLLGHAEWIEQDDLSRQLRAILAKQLQIAQFTFHLKLHTVFSLSSARAEERAGERRSVVAQ